LQIDAFTLLNNGGSGYDIACAQNNCPILYHLKGKPIVDKVSFNPGFKENIYFVYLNKKQSSKTAIANYQNNKTKNINKSIDAISKITLEILHATTLHFFSQAIENMRL
jgi:mevalonate kinase